MWEVRTEEYNMYKKEAPNTVFFNSLSFYPFYSLLLPLLLFFFINHFVLHLVDKFPGLCVLERRCYHCISEREMRYKKKQIYRCGGYGTS